MCQNTFHSYYTQEYELLWANCWRCLTKCDATFLMDWYTSGKGGCWGVVSDWVGHLAHLQTLPTFQKLDELVGKMDMKMFGDWNSLNVICSYLLP